MTTVDAPTASTTTDRYERRDVIGRGGMATVYKAYDAVAEMEVALKCLHDHLVGDPSLEEALQREATLMQRIDLPGVVQVHGTTHLDGAPAIVMECLPGGDLSERLADQGPLPEDRALDIITDLLETLGACHQAGIVHRDVKPHNILFDEDDRPRLIDFGIGQAEEVLAAGDAGQVGTVEYLAPERIDGLAIDGRSDIYSAGILLFELLCGHVPYQADDATALMHMHRQADIPDPQLFNPDISDPVARAIERALAKFPEERFDDTDAMLAALRGEDAPRESLPTHPRWETLRERYGDHVQWTADLDTRAAEWVLYVPPAVINDDEFEEHADLEAFQALLQRFQPYRTIDVAPDDLPKLFRDRGIARGLSRRGAEVLSEDLQDQGIIHSSACRPRHHRTPSTLRHLLSSPRLPRRLGPLVLMVPIVLMAALYYYQPADPTMAHGLLIVASAFAGVGIGWLAIKHRFLDVWMGYISTHYLLDLARKDRADGDDLLGARHLQRVDHITSPRIAASYRRALNMLLHLQDLVGDHRHPQLLLLLENIDQMAEELVTTEAEVAALRPAELTSQLRRLDHLIANSDDADQIQEWIDQKQSLRARLTQRDDAQLRLQSLGLQLHEWAATLEELVAPHTEAPDDLDLDALPGLIEELH